MVLDFIKVESSHVGLKVMIEELFVGNFSNYFDVVLAVKVVVYGELFLFFCVDEIPRMKLLDYFRQIRYQIVILRI